MLQIAATLRAWAAEGRRVAVATLIAVDGSAPRTIGAALAVDDTGRVAGSVSGGCVEADLVAECEQVLAGGPARRRRYGAGDWLEPGLMCGGTVEVLISDVAALDDAAWHQVERAAAGLDATLSLDAEGRACADDPMVTLSVRRPRHLVVVGAVEFGAALCALGARAGFAVTVLDHRATFATKERFPDATAVVVGPPATGIAERGWVADDAICILGHDPGHDTPAILAALRGGAGYVGAMGSRATHERRVEALHDLGASTAEITRLRSPIGLDLGGSTPEHTAVAILAEILAVQHGTTARPLSATDGPLHR
ncbi:XdhC family protein [Aeromicrobium duanguangcaii]|uniref:XdhC family protein n=1 Tax=Aeromicrobium duanguangcaii TaxID=2968086 RepID=A0ABY5KI35_9ACTN|nr:XdhC family protein [Aeromicrobium duanguangcaii]MCD9153504.1 XdhC family protein [Aeromicrobium duanguangcaii]UUI69408.1 XdhC family protein [Aeromicrobium duanguangcaii]